MKCKWIFFIPCEFKLFLILFSNRRLDTYERWRKRIRQNFGMKCSWTLSLRWWGIIIKHFPWGVHYWTEMSRLECPHHWSVVASISLGEACLSWGLYGGTKVLWKLSQLCCLQQMFFLKFQTAQPIVATSRKNCVCYHSSHHKILKFKLISLSQHQAGPFNRKQINYFSQVLILTSLNKCWTNI